MMLCQMHIIYIYIYIYIEREREKEIDIISIKLSWSENPANTHMRYTDHWTAISTWWGLIILTMTGWFGIAYGVAWTGGPLTEVRFLHSGVAGSISSGGDLGMHCWSDPIRLKQLFSVPYVTCGLFAGFSGHSNLINIYMCVRKNSFFFCTGIITDTETCIIDQNEAGPLWITSLPLNLVNVSLNINVLPSNKSMYTFLAKFCLLLF